MYNASILILLVALSVCYIKADSGNTFKSMENKRSQVSVTSTFDEVSSKAECVLRCTTQQGCSSVNFHGTRCELLEETSDFDPRLIDESAWTFLCKYNPILIFKRFEIIYAKEKRGRS